MWCKAWRAAICAMAVLLFAVGTPFLTLFWVPLIRLMSRNATTRRRRVRALIQRTFKILVAFLRVTDVIRITSADLDPLEKLTGTLVIANHPTYLDVVILLSRMPDADCVVKAELLKSPIFGGMVRAAEYISNEDSGLFLARCEAGLREGRNLLLFPEGTRSDPGPAFRFQRGAAHISLQTGAPILPVLILCEPLAWTKARSLYNSEDRPSRFTIEAGQLQSWECWIPDTPKDASMASRHLTQALESHFAMEWEKHESHA